LIDFKVDMNLVIKENDDWREVGWPQVAVHRNYHLFYLLDELFSRSVLIVKYIHQNNMIRF